MEPSYSFVAQIWMYQGEGAWHFITLPEEQAIAIKPMHNPVGRGFGSIKVTANIGNQGWNTSIFPDSKSNSYLLPIKKEIRYKLQLNAGDTVKVILRIVEL